MSVPFQSCVRFRVRLIQQTRGRGKYEGAPCFGARREAFTNNLAGSAVRVAAKVASNRRQPPTVRRPPSDRHGDCFFVICDGRQLLARQSSHGRNLSRTTCIGFWFAANSPSITHIPLERRHNGLGIFDRIFRGLFDRGGFVAVVAVSAAQFPHGHARPRTRGCQSRDIAAVTGPLSIHLPKRVRAQAMPRSVSNGRLQVESFLLRCVRD